MAKRTPKIRWRKSDVEALKREIKNFNRRLSTAKNKYGEYLNDIEYQSLKDYKERITTRAQYNQYIELLRFGKASTFNPSTSEVGEVVIPFEAKLKKSKRASKESKAKSRRDKLEEVLSSIDLNVDEQGMFPDENFRLKQRLARAPGNTRLEKLEYIMRDIGDINRLENYRTSFISAIINNINQYILTRNISNDEIRLINEKVNEIISIIQSLSPEAFYAAAGLNARTSIDYPYDTATFISDLDNVADEWKNYEGL